MTSGTPARVAPAPRAIPESRLRSYLRLGKLDVYDYYLSVPVALAATAAAGFELSGLPMLMVFLAAEIFMMAALVAFDDVTGYRDGSDIFNYGPDAPTRKKLRKPLVAGTLTERQALRFAWACALGALVAFGAAFALAPHHPMWAVFLVLANFLISIQYSYGLKLSYHGFQELFLVAIGCVFVIAPYGLATGEFSGFVFVQALLFGLGPLMFGVYSNTNDVEGDRAVGRPTVAALVSRRGNAVFIGALSAAEFLIGAVASVAGIAPWWFVLVMLPATALRARQYLIGFRGGDVMRARKAGFAVHRVSVLLLIVANVLYALGAAA
jgi:1,4-dihydroxy-2-naphthoate octaprenyltransferase